MALGLSPEMKLGGTLLFNLADGLAFSEFSQSFTVFDFIFGGSADNPTILTDSTLFADLTLMGISATRTIDIALLADGSLRAVPVPAAVWFFSTGLLALISVARRKKVA